MILSESKKSPDNFTSRDLFFKSQFQRDNDPIQKFRRGFSHRGSNFESRDQIFKSQDRFQADNDLIQKFRHEFSHRGSNFESRDLFQISISTGQ